MNENNENVMYGSQRVVEIAGAYGKLCSALAGVSIAGVSGDVSAFQKATSELRIAFEGYKSAVPADLRDCIIQTQAPEQTVTQLESLINQHG